MFVLALSIPGPPGPPGPQGIPGTGSGVSVTLMKETINGVYIITHLILYTLIIPMVLNVPAGDFPEVL